MNSRFLLAFLGVFIFVISLLLANLVAVGDYVAISILMVCIIGILYLIKIYQYSLIIILFVGLSGISLVLPIGRVESSYLALGLFSISAVYELFKKKRLGNSTNFCKAGVVFYLGSLALIICLFIYQIANPYNPYEFSMKQSFKAVIGFAGPFIVMFFWCINSSAFVFRIKSTNSILFTILIILVAHIGFRIYLISIGVLNEGEDRMSSEEVSIYYSFFRVVSISPFSLRMLGPLAVTLGIFIAMNLSADKVRGRETSSTFKISVILVLLGLIGSLVSAGRGSIILSLMAIIVAAIYYRRYVAILFSLAAISLVVGLTNIFSHVMHDNIPTAINRTLSLLVISDNSISSRSIQSSSDWRGELADMAYDEWISDSNIFIRGRGVYEFSYLDINSTLLEGGYTGKMISALKTSNVHNGILSIALKFGLLGVILNYILHFYLCIRGSFVSYKYRKNGLYPMFVASVYFLCVSLILSFFTSGGINFIILILLLSSASKLELVRK